MKETQIEPKSEKDNQIDDEDFKTHPELHRKPDKTVDRWRRKQRHFVSEKKVESFNKKYMSNILLATAIILGLINIVFGVLGILAIFGLSDEGSWLIYERTSFLGWEQLRITGFILIIIGILMIWSAIYYFMDKNQKADSYLIIGAGIGVLFLFIYILIILADILTALVEFLSSDSEFKITTYLYLPILLGIVAGVILRILIIRHIVILPSVSAVSIEPSLNKHEDKKGFRNWRHYKRKKRFKRNGHHRGKSRRRKNHWRDND